MSQRLGIAGALLGDPEVLLFDEPVNGLDLDGVRWARALMRSLADEGRTVFVSSHLLSEMQQTTDRLLVIGRGRLLADAGVAEFLAHSGRAVVIVRSPDVTGLTALAYLATARHAAPPATATGHHLPPCPARYTAAATTGTAAIPATTTSPASRPTPGDRTRRR